MRYIFDDDLVLSFQKKVEKSLIEFFREQDLVAFQMMLRDGMNTICATIQQRLLERIDDCFVRDVPSRRDWVIERKKDKKTVLSPFGPVTYNRTYFKNKRTGQYAHLADKTVGYLPHQRLDLLLEADIVGKAGEPSYRKAGLGQERDSAGTGVSGQTVLNLVRRFELEQIRIKELSRLEKIETNLLGKSILLSPLEQNRKKYGILFGAI